VIVFCLALSLGASGVSAAAQKSVAHLESCTRWGYIDQGGYFGTSNTCNRSVALRFLAKSSPQIVERALNPGEVFDSGLTREQIETGWWMFTTCPVGYQSNVAFVPENRGVIIPSKYRCVERQ
jgi:hypothetical protein